VRTAIETISLQRTEKSQPKAQQGMKVVLERLRHGGLVEVLEGMRADREVEV
jgi:4-amino-4-deoxychorismate lyase